MFRAKNAKVEIWLTATWSRADQTYPDGKPWHGKPIQQMGIDMAGAYAVAAKNAHVTGVVPVGLAWNRAIDTGVAGGDPYAGIPAGKINLWAWDSYHASAYGYYLEALLVFAKVTGKDPQSLGDTETVADDMGFPSRRPMRCSRSRMTSWRHQISWDSRESSKMKKIMFGLSLFLAAPAIAEEPDGLILPPGFHASVVAEGLGPLRHMAVRPNGDIYASTGGEGAKPEGLVAIQLGADGKAARVEHFSTSMAAPASVFITACCMPRPRTPSIASVSPGNALLPDGEAETVVAGLPRGGNHAIAFDDRGNLFVGLGAKSNACSTKPAPGAKPVGQKPCPDLSDGGGIWRFAADRTNQSFSRWHARSPPASAS